jgi:hypothetical protein
VAGQSKSTKAAPLLNTSTRKPATSKKLVDSGSTASNVIPLNQTGGTKSQEQKITQTEENPKQRYVKGIPQKSDAQPRARF